MTFQTGSKGFSYRRALANIYVILNNLLLVRVETRGVVGRKNHHAGVSEDGEE